MAERKKFVVPDPDDVEKNSNARPKVKPLFKTHTAYNTDGGKGSGELNTDRQEAKKSSGQEENKKKDITGGTSRSTKPARNLQFRSGVSRQFNAVALPSARQDSGKSNSSSEDPEKRTTNSEPKPGICQSSHSSSAADSNSTKTVTVSGANAGDSDTCGHQMPGSRKVGMTFAEAFADLKDTKHYAGPQGTEKPAPGATVTATKSSNSIIVNPRQRGNPILKHIRNVPWEFGDVIPDYVTGKTTCALFLSIRYHNLKPDYIHDRLKQLGQSYELRVLLVQVDVKDPHHAVKDLTKIAILADCTLILAWSPEEAGRYLETYKAYENKSADMLKERVDSDYLSRATDCLTTVKKVNKTDVVTLLSTFKSMEGIAKATKEELALCPGVGQQKAQRLSDIFHEPFLRSKKAKTEEPKPGTSKHI